jgi:hypothetical protein
MAASIVGARISRSKAALVDGAQPSDTPGFGCQRRPRPLWRA